MLDGKFVQLGVFAPIKSGTREYRRDMSELSRLGSTRLSSSIDLIDRRVSRLDNFPKILLQSTGGFLTSEDSEEHQESSSLADPKYRLCLPSLILLTFDALLERFHFRSLRSNEKVRKVPVSGGSRGFEMSEVV